MDKPWTTTGIVMKQSILYATIVIWISCTLPAASETWRIYHKQRFGTTAQVPAGWEPDLPGPVNGDGLKFLSPDKRATITVSAIRNIDESGRDENAIFVEPREGEIITYAKRGSNWAVASGTNGDKIFYRKQVMTCQDSIENHIWIEYPSTEKARYNSIVSHVASTLRGGSGWQTDSCR